MLDHAEITSLFNLIMSGDKKSLEVADAIFKGQNEPDQVSIKSQINEHYEKMVYSEEESDYKALTKPLNVWGTVHSSMRQNDLNMEWMPNPVFERVITPRIMKRFDMGSFMVPNSVAVLGDVSACRLILGCGRLGLPPAYHLYLEQNLNEYKRMREWWLLGDDQELTSRYFRFFVAKREFLPRPILPRPILTNARFGSSAWVEEWLKDWNWSNKRSIVILKHGPRPRFTSHRMPLRRLRNANRIQYNNNNQHVQDKH